MHPVDARPRSPSDFSSLLKTQEPTFLVGGQAVNLWALYYRKDTADLAPFVSRDADVLGDRETLLELGKIIGVKPRFFPLKPPKNEVGVVISADSEGSPILIEVLRNLNGVTNEELREPSYLVAIGDSQTQVRIPGPIALLKAKIANVVSIKQTDRQDGRRIVILSRVIPEYLKDIQAVARTGSINEGEVLKLLEQLIDVISGPAQEKVLSEVGISRISLFSSVKADSLPKVENFLRSRLPHAISS
ncbi:MAG TPA: hypothetical protein VFE25_07605 [Opitutaceae bacterium]|jgi:hypothetical protein|nr:hypothetical protein [Opitutaceae bacterium]